jgi:hypothetical protein
MAKEIKNKQGRPRSSLSKASRLRSFCALRLVYLLPLAVPHRVGPPPAASTQKKVDLSGPTTPVGGDNGGCC